MLVDKMDFCGANPEQHGPTKSESWHIANTLCPSENRRIFPRFVFQRLHSRAASDKQEEETIVWYGFERRS